jgi:hypothetical protein
MKKKRKEKSLPRSKKNNSRHFCLKSEKNGEKYYFNGAYPIEATLRCSTLGLAPTLTHKHWARFERLGTMLQNFFAAVINKCW